MLSRILKITVVFVLSVGLAGLLAFYTMRFVVKQEKTVIVPDLMGKTAVETLMILSEKNLNAKLSGFKFSENVEESRVMDQSPGPGDRVKEGRDVSFVLSRGRETVVIPAFVGMKREDALNLIESKGLLPGHISFTSEGTANQILAQFPPAEDEIQKGGRVDLLVSTGPSTRTFITPNIVGKNLLNAVLEIEEHHLIPGRVERRFEKSKPLNIILSQTPKPGHPVSEQTAVYITVNKREGNGKTDDIKGVHLFRYSAPFGYLKKNVRVVLNAYGLSNTLYEGFAEPGEDLWFFIPKNETATIYVYEGDEEIMKKNYGM